MVSLSAGCANLRDYHPQNSKSSEFEKLSHLPDSTPGNDGHYKAFNEVFNKPTTEEHRPLSKKPTGKGTLPFRASVQHVAPSLC